MPGFRHLWERADGCTLALQRPARLRRAGLVLNMLKTRQVILIITGVLGVLLVVRGAWGGVWPLSIQLIAGVLLLVFAGLRWWTLK